MAELTSTKIYGDLEVVRNVKTNTLQVQSSGDIDIQTIDGTLVGTMNATGYQIISGAAQAGSYGFLVRDSALQETDYQYLYWNNSSNYGGMFNRQGTSNSDLRQEYNYLKWFTSSAGATSYERFGCSTTEFVVNEDSQNLDFRVESDTNTHAIFVDAANSFMGMNNSTPNCTLNLGGSFRIDDSSERPNAGTGLEFYFDNSTGYIHPYNRTGNDYAGSGMDIRGESIILRATSGNSTRQNALINWDNIVFNEDGTDVDFRIESSLFPYSFFMRGDTVPKVGMGEMSTEAEATYKMLNLRFYEANSGAKLTSVGAQASNDGMLLYNDYTVTGHASIDFVVDTNYDTTYNAGRFGWYGYGTTSTSTDYNYFFWTGYSGSTTWETMRLHRLGNLYVRADVVAYSTVITSDERLKKNIEDLDDNILDKLMQLRPVTFEWKDETKRGDSRVSGLIAQEVETIFPELISESPNLDEGVEDEDKTEYKHVRYNELIPYLTKGMQEQQKIIDSQKKEIDELKEKMALVLEKLSL